MNKSILAVLTLVLGSFSGAAQEHTAPAANQPIELLPGMGLRPAVTWFSVIRKPKLRVVRVSLVNDFRLRAIGLSPSRGYTGGGHFPQDHFLSKRYYSPRQLLRVCQELLAAFSPANDASPFDDVLELLYDHRKYFWIGIYFVLGDKVVRQAMQGPMPRRATSSSLAKGTWEPRDRVDW